MEGTDEFPWPPRWAEEQFVRDLLDSELWRSRGSTETRLIVEQLARDSTLTAQEFLARWDSLLAHRLELWELVAAFERERESGARGAAPTTAPADGGPISDSQYEEYASPVKSNTGADSASASGGRYVNLCFTAGPEHRPLAASLNLAAGREYELRVDIGALSPASIVENPRRFPDEALPPSESGHWVKVAASSTSFTVDSRVFPFFLPTAGPAWVCACDQEAEAHVCRPEERSPYLRIRLVPTRPGIASLRMSVAFRGGLVQSHLITAQVSEQETVGSGTRARIDYTLAPGLADVGALPARDIHVLTERGGERTHTLTFGSLDEVVSFQLTEGQMASAMSAVRTALRDVHMDNSRPPRNLLDAVNGKTRQQLEGDLRRLAPLGRRLWNLLLGDQPERRRLLRDRLRRPSTIQVARSGRSALVFPWALVYDIALADGDPRAHHLCRVMESFGPAALVAEECPYESEHRLNTLCPYGFWGLRHSIEQPPSMSLSRTLPLRISAPPPREMVVCLSENLDRKITDHHLDGLRGLLPDILLTVCSSRAQVVAGLAKNELPLLYFYCHGKREQVPGASEPLPYLEVGAQERITPGDIIAWFDSDWPVSHWMPTGPLVFINGCHTAELTPNALAQFVDAFAGVYASGVIGTETAVHQALAGEVAEQFWHRFRSGDSVGAALAHVRRHLLSKGNLLGLAYTAYCSASLSLSASAAGSPEVPLN